MARAWANQPTRAFTLNCHTRQNNSKFGELAGLRIDLYRPRVLLDDNVVTDGKTEPSSFTGRLCREERIEQLRPYLRRDAGAVVAYPDFDLVTEALWSPQPASA